MVIKEFLGSPTAKRLTLPDLARVAPAERWLVREPMGDAPEQTGGWKFAMLKWLDKCMEERWNWSQSAYLGLAFD